MTVLRILSLLALVTFILPGCGTRRVEIDRQTKRTIDTLAAREIYALRPTLDSLCATKQDSLVEVLTDSILLERRREILKLIGK